jgi:hypothetical protein
MIKRPGFQTEMWLQDYFGLNLVKMAKHVIFHVEVGVCHEVPTSSVWNVCFES